ncbi:hypothetical protein Franean1_3604 [Parafrankia sp. EAN1pec]|nr:hypothetical protein Franean1_3604 [Frankia sp. EAN1pec]
MPSGGCFAVLPQRAALTADHHSPRLAAQRGLGPAGRQELLPGIVGGRGREPRSRRVEIKVVGRAPARRRRVHRAEGSRTPASGQTIAPHVRQVVAARRSAGPDLRVYEEGDPRIHGPLGRQNHRSTMPGRAGAPAVGGQTHQAAGSMIRMCAARRPCSYYRWFVGSGW